MLNELVSLMMPTRNRHEFIIDAILSVLSQSYRNWELLILDDASTDKTEKIIRLFNSKDSRIKYFRSEQQLGIARSRNILLQKSKGKFVGHLDDDDILHPQAINQVMGVFNTEPNVALVYSDLIKINAEGEVIGEDKAVDFSQENLPYLGFKHFTIYKKKVALDVGGFNEMVEGCEDGDLFMKIANKYQCKHISQFLYYYRSHTTNFGHKRPKCENCEKQDSCNFIKIWKNASKRLVS